MEYIRKHPYANRRGLVGDPLVVADPVLTPHHQLCDTAEGLEFLHSRDVVHGNLKGVRDCSEPILSSH